MVKSLLRYPGGKQKLSKEIVRNFCPFKEYREPFLGGGSVFLYVRQVFYNKKDIKYWINDNYSILYTFWKVLQNKDSCLSLITQIKYWKDLYKEKGKDLYNFLKYKLDNYKIKDEIEKAAILYILNRITYSGLIEKGRYSESAFKGRFTVPSNKFLQFPTLLANVKITNYNYEEVLNEEGEEVFLYIDPPYYTKSLYGNKKSGFFNHEELSKNLKNLKHKWLLSYNNDEYIKKLYSFACIKEIEVTYTISRKKGRNRKESEFLIANYDLSKNHKIEYFSLF